MQFYLIDLYTACNFIFMFLESIDSPSLFSVFEEFALKYFSLK